MTSPSLTRRDFSRLALGAGAWAAVGRAATSDAYHFDRTISREVLENYLAARSRWRACSTAGATSTTTSACSSTPAPSSSAAASASGRGEANLLRNLERAKEQIPKVHAADPEMILQACIFEIVTTQVEQVPVPDWAFAALGQPVEKRNFRYADMLYPDGRRKDHWGRQCLRPRREPAGDEALVLLPGGVVHRPGLRGDPLRPGRDDERQRPRPRSTTPQVLDLVRSYAAKHARRHMVLCDAHVPSGGLVRDGQAAHGLPLVPAADQGGPRQAAGGDPEGRLLRRHLRPEQGRHDAQRLDVRAPALSGRDRQLGRQPAPRQGEAGRHLGLGLRRDHLVRAPEPEAYRNDWLRYAWDWVRKTDPAGHLQMPGSRTMRSPLDGKRWYYANKPSAAVPEGYSQEEAIRAIWAADPPK